MAKHPINSVKLGVFVLAGLLFLILMLYMIGRDQSLFGSTIKLRARFGNVQGLVPGNNVRYAGIEVGTVKKIDILSDTLVEVAMLVDKKMKNIIRKNAVASIVADGLMGNKVINIEASQGIADFVDEEDILETKKPLDTDEMLRTLHNTNSDIAEIASNLKTTVLRLNNSAGLWDLLNDKSVSTNLRLSAANIRMATFKAAEITNDFESIVKDIKDGKGSLGSLLSDTAISTNLNDALSKIKQVGEEADKLAKSLQIAVEEVRGELVDGKGAISALMKDSSMVTKIANSLDHIEKGTDAFNENMEALKYSFLLRGYFRKMEKEKQKAAKKEMANQ